jgi:TolB-like protein/DNA-binding winged helix-turn-helix (wHTH) protein/tetratricopeptide (TPR) repeat protein
MQNQAPPDKKAAQPRFRIDDLEVDIGKAEVKRGGELIALPKLSFDLLRALIDLAPAIATIDDLLQQVWPGLVVSPETVAQRVMLLRDAIGDDSKQPRYILGVRGRGYRLIPLAEPIPDSVQSPQSPVDPAEGRPPQAADAPVQNIDDAKVWMTSAHRRTLVAAAIIAMAILILVAMRVASVRTRVQTAAEVTRTDLSKVPLPPRTVAVLQFLNLGNQPQDEYVASGLAESIRLRLGGLSQIVVIARSSTSGYNGKNINAPTIGRELNARYLLEGTLQRQANSMRITAQLVDAETGHDVWSVFFDRQADDIFSVQEEISTKVARALKVTLDTSDETRRAGLGTNNLDAYLEYLQARGLVMTSKLPDVQSGIEHFQRAIDLDPNFSTAFSGLAASKIALLDYRQTDNSQSEWKPIEASVRKLLRRALDLDPRNAEAYLLLGDIEDDEMQSGIYYRRAVELEPNSARAHYALAQRVALAAAETSTTAVDDEIVHLNKAMQIDPLEPSYARSMALTYLYRRTGDMAKVEPLLLHSLELNPAYFPALLNLAELRFCCQRRSADAIKIAEHALAEDPSSTWVANYLMHMYLFVGDIAAAENVAAPLRLKVLRMGLLAARRQWREAAQVLYQSQSELVGIHAVVAALVVRMDARDSHQWAAARKFLEERADIKWDPGSTPIVQVPMSSDMGSAIALADVLQLSGEQERARKILEMVLASMDTAAVKFKRGDRWFTRERIRALVMLGRDEQALSLLAGAAENATTDSWFQFEVDPVFDRVRHDSRFEGFLNTMHRAAAEQLVLVRQMRAQGEIPARAAP